MKILFVNCCIRGEESQTLRLCRAALDEIASCFPQAQVEELCLDKEELLLYTVILWPSATSWRWLGSLTTPCSAMPASLPGRM